MGKTRWEIGTIIGLTEHTINFHIARVCEKLGVHHSTGTAIPASARLRVSMI